MIICNVCCKIYTKSPSKMWSYSRRGIPPSTYNSSKMSLLFCSWISATRQQCPHHFDLPQIGTRHNSLHWRNKRTGSPGCGAVCTHRWNECWRESSAAWMRTSEASPKNRAILYTERLFSTAIESEFDLKAILVAMLGRDTAVIKSNVREQDSVFLSW